MNKKMIIYSAFRNKKYIVYTILITLLFILSYIFCLNYNYYDYQINDVLGEKEVNRGLILYYEEDNIEDLISEINHIDNFFPLYNNINIKIGKNTYKINSDFKKDIVYGKSIEKDNELIISMLYFRTLEINESEIGYKTIDLAIDGKKNTFTIVGVTDDNHSHFYINTNAINNVLNVRPNSYYLLVDTFSNVQSVVQYVQDKNYSIEYYDSGSLYEIEEVQKAKKSFIYLCILIILCLTLFFINIIKNIFTSELKNISLFKAIGFKNKSIRKVITSRVTTILTLSFIITLILTVLLSFIINKSYISIILLVKELGLIYLFGILIIYLSSITLMKKINRVNIIENLKS